MSYCGCAWHKDLPLHEAIVKGEIDVVKSLVESEADIEEVDCGGNTALLLAIKVKQVEIIKYLIERKAFSLARDIDAKPCSFFMKGIDDDDAVLQFLKLSTSQKTSNYMSKILEIKDQLIALPDCQIKLKISLESWVPFVTSFLPNDDITLTKSAKKIRIDYNYSSFGWNRGNNSIIVDFTDNQYIITKYRETIYYVDRIKKYYTKTENLLEVNDEDELLYTDEMNKQLVDAFLTAPGLEFDFNSKNVSFTPYKSWMNPDSVYMISNCKCFGYDMNNLVIDIYSCAFPNLKRLPNNGNPFTLKIGRNEKLVKKYHLDKGGKIKYRVKPNKCDIYFSLLKENTETKEEEVIVEEIQLTEFYESTYVSDCECDVTMVFNNSGSYFRTKEVEYIVGIKLGQINKTYIQGIPKTGCVYNNVDVPIISSNISQSAKFFLSPDFPFSISDFLPFAKIISKSNEHFEHFSNFFSMKFPVDSGFPVKAEIPFGKVFQLKFKFLFAAKTTTDPSFFEIPEDFMEKHGEMTRFQEPPKPEDMIPSESK